MSKPSEHAEDVNMDIRLVSIVAPVYNEEANLDEMVQRCVAVGDAPGCDYE